MATKLSVVIITLNEEDCIGRALKSIENIADEIIIVDSGSTDKTIEIAKRFGAKIYFRKFDNYGAQKNYAAEKAKGEWILSLDADEEISIELANEIQQYITKSQQTFVAFSIPRKNIILGKFIKYTRWQPELDRHVWLWRKDSGKWSGDVHEEVEIFNGSIGKLINPKIHYQYDTVREFLSMMNNYSEIESNEKNKRISFSILRLIIDPVYNFLIRYFYRFGLLDGWRGFVLSYLMALYHFEVWIKVWERRR